MPNVISLERARQSVPATKADLLRIEIGIETLRRSLRPVRRRLGEDTKRAHLATISQFFAGMCPCCGEVKVVEDGMRLKSAEYDHWSDNPEKSGQHETWLICGTCHKEFTRGLRDRHDNRTEYEAYQRRRKRAVERLQPRMRFE